MAENLEMTDRIKKIAESADVAAIETILNDMIPKEAGVDVKYMAGGIRDAIANNKDEVIAGAMPIAGAAIGAGVAGKGRRMKGALAGGGMGAGLGALLLLVRHLQGKGGRKFTAEDPEYTPSTIGGTGYAFDPKDDPENFKPTPITLGGGPEAAGREAFEPTPITLGGGPTPDPKDDPENFKPTPITER